MPIKAILSVVKTIQIRTEWVDENGEVKHSRNERFRQPQAAARNYARIRIAEWRRVRWEEDLYGAAYHRQTAADFEYEQRLEERYYNFLVRNFKELIN